MTASKRLKNEKIKNESIISRDMNQMKRQRERKFVKNLAIHVFQHICLDFYTLFPHLIAKFAQSYSDNF